MPESFVLRADERGNDRMPSTGDYASYVAGHPDGVITRRSSFNFHQGAARCGDVELERRDSAGFQGGAPLAIEPRRPGTDLLLVETVL